MPKWVNRTVGTAARNGTTSHTITFATDGSAPFAPTAGRLLVVVVSGAVTHSWSAGWTERLQPVNNSELSVATRTVVAGDSAVTITHNGSNYPVNYAVYEFPAGSSWVNGVGQANVLFSTTATPTVTGLPGTPVTVAYAVTGARPTGAPTPGAVWTAPAVEDLDLDSAFSATDGTWLTVAYTDDVTATSAAGALTISPSGAVVANTTERVAFAVSVPASTTGVLAATLPVPAAALTADSSGPVAGTLAGAAPLPTAALAGTVEVPPTPPTVTAGRARPVVRGQGVVLDVVATPPGGQTISSHAWTIQSGGGSLTGASTATPTWTAPGAGSGLAVIRDTVTASGGGTATADVTVGYHANIVAAENLLDGTARSSWDLPTSALGGIATLQGFADGFSADRSDPVDFKVAQSDGAGWSAEVFRLGWYDGDGARSYGTLVPTSGQLADSQSQPTPGDADAGTTKLSADCGNWHVTLTWTPPAWAPSGMYVLRLNRTGGGASHVLFILRDDARQADLMVMPSDSTWNAYNAFGGMGSGSWLAGNSLYFGTALNQYDNDCARFVSYDRPMVNRQAAVSGVSYGAVEWSTFFTGEYPMLRFLERNGVDAKYYGCIDAAGDPSGALLGSVSAAMMIGHNEYWSDGMRSGWEAAKADGLSVFSCAANEVFWRLVGTDPDAEGRPRTWECQKSTIDGRGNTRPEWTGTWRDPDGAGKGGDDPENTFTGTIFVVNGPDLRSLVVPKNGGYADQPLWRDTSVAALTAGQSYTSPNQILGFEWDTYGPAGVGTTGANFLADPHPQVRYCSTATYAVSSLVLTDAGDVYGSGNVTHRLVAMPSGEAGGITFGTGTINWALGCDDANTYQLGNDNTSTPIRQATLNMLADMGAPPATTMAGLTEPDPVTWFSNLGVLAGSLPVPTAQATGTVRASGAVTASLPTPTSALAGQVRAAGVVAGALPAPTAAIAGLLTAGGALAGALPAPVAALAGSVDSGGGLLSAALPMPSLVLSGQVRAAGVLAAALPLPVGSLQGATSGGPAVGVLAAALPEPVAAVTGTVRLTGALAATLPSPTAALSTGARRGRIRLTYRQGWKMTMTEA